MQITRQQIEPRHFVGVRRTVKHNGIGPACGEIFPRLAQWLGERGIAPTHAPTTLYHSMSRETGELVIQPGFFVGQALAGDGDIEAISVDGGEVLTATHVGPYDTLGGTWTAVFARAEELGREVNRASWEEYVDDPGCVDAAQLRTVIVVPID